jgi:hypothetical protein
MFFAIFGHFLKIYQNMGQKLGSNIYDRRSERGEERIPECERRQCDEYERVQFSPMAIFDKMVMKKGNIAVTMGLIR